MGLTSYTGPVYSVKIVRPVDGSTVIDFSAWGESYNLKDGENFPFLQSLSVTELMNRPSFIDLKLTPPFDQWKWFLEQVGEHLFKSFIEVKLGYEGLMSRVYSAQIQSIPDVTISAGYVEVELEARGGAFAASRIRSGILEEKGKSLDKLKAFEVLKKISKEYGITLYHLHPEKGEVEIDSPPSSLSNLDEQLETVPDGSDFRMMRKIIVVKARYGFYNSGNRLVIFNPAEVGEKDVTPVYTFRGSVDPQNNRFPIVDFTSKSNTPAFLRGVRKVRSQSVNKDKKEVVSEEVTGQEKGAQRKFHREGKDKAGNEGQKPNKAPVSHRDPDKKGKLWYEKNTGEEMSGIQVEVTTMGNPSITPGEVVRVHNIGAMFNGHYYVQEVTHEGSTDGYTTSFSGITYGSSNKLNELMERVRKDVVNKDSGEKPSENSSNTTKKQAKPSSQSE